VLARDFRRIDPRSARVVLIEAGPRNVIVVLDGAYNEYLDQSDEAHTSAMRNESKESRR